MTLINLSKLIISTQTLQNFHNMASKLQRNTSRTGIMGYHRKMK